MDSIQAPHLDNFKAPRAGTSASSKITLPMTILGLNLSHDTSVAIIDEGGGVIFALEEERLNRIKQGGYFPAKVLSHLSENTNFLADVKRVIIGSTDNMSNRLAAQIYSDYFRAKYDIYENPHEWFSFSRHAESGLHRDVKELSGKKVIANLLSKEFGLNKKIEFVNHHDGHLGCGLGLAKSSKSLIFSLDNQGDGESAALSLVVNRKPIYRKQLAKNIDSLGELYSATTELYGLKRSRHEGKVMGLAAWGSSSSGLEVFLDHVSVEEGVVRLKYIKSRRIALLNHILKNQFGFRNKFKSSISEIALAAARETELYPDLAYAIQALIEERVSQLVEFWVTREDCSDVVLTGGVFSNVKLNQRITEIKGVKTVSVFPNMGDGGLSIGGAWWNLARSDRLSENEQLFENMYLGNVETISYKAEQESIISKQFVFSEYNEERLASEVAKQISEGKILGVHRKEIEFGPRALGNRSILADPRTPNIVKRLNNRLGRTEFMPFAPVILEEFFEEFMLTRNQTMQPFYYMAMTCDVKPAQKGRIPAVVHIDGTARPQVVSRSSNLFLYSVLRNFHHITGVPVLVNTSFNIHEEPINGVIEDSLKCLKLGVIDSLVTTKGLYQLA